MYLAHLCGSDTTVHGFAIVYTATELNHGQEMCCCSLEPRPSSSVYQKKGEGKGGRMVWEIGLLFWWQTYCSRLCMNETAK